MNINKIKRLKKIGMFTVGGILSGIIGNLIKRENALADFQVSAIAGLSAGVIMEIFDDSSPDWRQRRRNSWGTNGWPEAIGVLPGSHRKRRVADNTPGNRACFPCMHCEKLRPKSNLPCKNCGKSAGWARCGGGRC